MKRGQSKQAMSQVLHLATTDSVQMNRSQNPARLFSPGFVSGEFGPATSWDGSVMCCWHRRQTSCSPDCQLKPVNQKWASASHTDTTPKQIQDRLCKDWRVFVRNILNQAWWCWLSSFTAASQPAQKENCWCVSLYGSLTDKLTTVFKPQHTVWPIIPPFDQNPFWQLILRSVTFLFARYQIHLTAISNKASSLIYCSFFFTE